MIIFIRTKTIIIIITSTTIIIIMIIILVVIIIIIIIITIIIIIMKMKRIHDNHEIPRGEVGLEGERATFPSFGTETFLNIEPRGKADSIS